MYVIVRESRCCRLHPPPPSANVSSRRCTNVQDDFEIERLFLTYSTFDLKSYFIFFIRSLSLTVCFKRVGTKKRKSALQVLPNNRRSADYLFYYYRMCTFLLVFR